MKWFYATTNPHFRRIGTEQVKTQQNDYHVVRAQMGHTTVAGRAFKTTGPLPEKLRLTSILQETC
jgi:hypothetical protein